VSDKKLVTADNFPRAETDMYFSRFSQDHVGMLLHHREPANADNQKVVRDNPNVLGTVAVFDLDAGPVTLTLPDPGERFVSLMVTDEDHYTTTTYDSGEHSLTRDEVGTRYVFVAIRILVDPSDPDDVAAVTRSRTRSLSTSPAAPARSRSPTGTPRARARCARR
jgi:hypothetical protein